MNSQKHIINKVFLEVNTSSTKTAYNLKDNLDVFLKERVFPNIEAYFKVKSAAYPMAAIRFNKIELQISHLDLNNLNPLKDRIIGDLKKKMDQILDRVAAPSNEGDLVVVDNNTNRLDAFFFFLTTGKNPWWKQDIASNLDVNAIRRMISQNGFKQRFLTHLTNKTVRERLINQFDDSILTILLSNVPIPTKKAPAVLKKNKGLRTKFWKAVINYTLIKEAPLLKTTMYQLMKAAITSDSETKELEAFTTTLIGESLEDVEPLEFVPLEEDELQQELLETDEEAEGIFINNAGLVLLHPFLKNFFILTKLANSGGQIFPQKEQIAVHLLHYLGTKKEQQLESEMVLEKFLCGYPIERSIERYIKLSKGLKQKAEELLQSIVSHWPALKNTSPDGLRTGFLQREGKLIIEEDKYRLIVERKTQDILLDKMPWNIHLFKLPWLDKLIFVEW